MSDYLIWSNEHQGWWGPARTGYVQRIENAGCYTHDQALQICMDAMPGRRDDEPLQEIPVRLEDLSAMLHFFAGRFPGHDPEPGER